MLGHALNDDNKNSLAEPEKGRSKERMRQKHCTHSGMTIASIRKDMGKRNTTKITGQCVVPKRKFLKHSGGNSYANLGSDKTDTAN